MQGDVPTPPDGITGQLLLPIIISCLNALGYCEFGTCVVFPGHVRVQGSGMCVVCCTEHAADHDGARICVMRMAFSIYCRRCPLQHTTPRTPTAGAYISLTALGSVAIWTTLLGTAVIFPISYGILVRGESAGRRKLMGVALCVLAAVVLGIAGASEYHLAE